MAVPSYATDLATLNLSTGTWGELTGAAAGSAPTENDSDNFIAGTDSTTEAVRNSGLSSMYAPANTTAVTSGDAVFMWLYFAAMPNMATYASAGFSVAIGSGVGDYDKWTVAGSDTLPYGGWFSVAVDPLQAVTATVGSPSGTLTYFGSVINLTTGIAKGNAFANDYQRHGRALIVTDGQAADYGVFSGAAAANDTVTARWGLFAAVSGGYSQKGLFQFGSAATAVDFRDSNVNIVIEDTTHCAAGFNEFEVLNTGSNVELVGVTISALGTQSPGLFTVTDNAPVVLTGCTFNDMGVFTFQTNTDSFSCTYRRCGQIVAAGADMTDSIVTGYEGTAGTAALSWNVATDTNGLLDDMSFTKGTAATHAIELGTNTPATISLSGHLYSGYNASDEQNDSTIYNNSGKAITINITGDGNLPSIRNGTSASTSVVLSKNYTLTGVANPSEVTILDRDISLLDVIGTPTALSFGNATATERTGQSFQVTTAGKVERIRLNLKKIGTPTDGITIRLVNGVPGSTLTSTSVTIAAADLTTAFVEFDVDLNGKYSLATATTYGIEIQRTGAVNAADYYQVEYDTTSVHASGVRYVYNAGWSSTTGDLLFYVMEAASDNELYHVESVTTGTTTYSHGGTTKDIEVLVASLNYKQVILIDSISAADKSVPILQIPDLVYSA